MMAQEVEGAEGEEGPLPQRCFPFCARPEGRALSMWLERRDFTLSRRKEGYPSGSPATSECYYDRHGCFWSGEEVVTGAFSPSQYAPSNPMLPTLILHMLRHELPSFFLYRLHKTKTLGTVPPGLGLLPSSIGFSPYLNVKLDRPLQQGTSSGNA